MRPRMGHARLLWAFLRGRLARDEATGEYVEMRPLLSRMSKPPRLRTITLDVLEAACEAVGADVDDVLDGRAPPEPKKMAHARAFLAAVLENSDDFRLGEMHPQAARALYRIVAANFWCDSARPSSAPSRAGGATAI